MMSSLVLRRKAGIHEFTDEFVQRRPVQDMMRKVTTVRDRAIEGARIDRMRSIIEVDLTDGQTLVQEADGAIVAGPETIHARGAPPQVH